MSRAGLFQLLEPGLILEFLLDERKVKHVVFSISIFLKSVIALSYFGL